MSKQNNPTLLQYLEQCKKDLAKKKPIIGNEKMKRYIVKSYCRLPTGTCLEEKEDVKLRPGDLIRITFIEANNDLIPKKVVVAKSELYENYNNSLYWKPKQLQRWLNSNTREQKYKK